MLNVITLAASLLACPPDSILTSRVKHPICYETPSRIGVIVFDDSVWWGGARASTDALEGHDVFYFPEFLGNPLEDCSSESMRCLASEDMGFAVPKKSRDVNGEYATKGGKMVLDKCLLGFGEQCHIMRLRMESAKTPGTFTYYVYHESFGIVSFGVSGPDEKPQSGAEAAAIASQYILQGGYGLFGSPGKKNKRH